MASENVSGILGSKQTVLLAIIVLISNAFTWYFATFITINSFLDLAHVEGVGALAIWIINSCAAAFTGLIVASRTSKSTSPRIFLSLWVLFGIMSSAVPLFMAMTTFSEVALVAFLWGAAFGFGMPLCMEYYADNVVSDNRGKIGGIVYFVAYVGIFYFGIMRNYDLQTQLLAFVAWRAFGFVFLWLIKPKTIQPKGVQDPSYISILRERRFILYFIPWLMLSLVNYLNTPILKELFGEDFIVSSSLLEGLLIGIFAMVGGFLSDKVGRKRIVVSGFVIIGLGYAVLGVFPVSLISWYFYTIVDGIAWGMFGVTLVMTLWGDLAYEKPSKKYYALGGLPFLFANTLQMVIGRDVARSVSVYAVFPLTSLFLFLAVLPLMYAPETLPEKKIRERELKDYVEKARKTKEKYA
jgi:MFS family permease